MFNVVWIASKFGKSPGVAHTSSYCTVPSASITNAALLLTPCISKAGNTSYKTSNDFEAALVANTNVGGDNCHRGAVLGALLGATLGYEAIPKRWINGLTAHDELNEEIEQFIQRFE